MGDPAKPMVAMLSYVVGATSAYIVLNFVPQGLPIDAGSIAGALSMVLMVMTRTFHPSASAYAYVCVKNGWSGVKPFVTPGLAGTFVLCCAAEFYHRAIDACKGRKKTD